MQQKLLEKEVNHHQHHLCHKLCFCSAHLVAKVTVVPAAKLNLCHTPFHTLNVEWH